jgi:hypothetical protein
MINGRCMHLHTKAQPARVHDGEVRHLVCFNDLDIPLNRLVERKTTSGDKLLFHSTSVGRAEVLHGGVQFEFEKLEELPGSTELICRSPTPLPAAFDQRVQEALRLVTFSPVTWTVSQQNLRGVATVGLTATAALSPGVLPPPVPADRAADDFWRLLGLYLDYVCQNPNPGSIHRLSASLKPLLSLHKLQVETVALALGVATEAILRSEYPEIGKPLPTFLQTEVAPQNETVFAGRISGSLQVKRPPRAAGIGSTRYRACAGQAQCAVVGY